MKNERFRSPLAMAFLLLAACGNGEGRVDIHLYGESFVEDGIPSEEMADGWSVTFERFDVSVSELFLGGVSFDAMAPVDLAEQSDGTGHLLATSTVSTGEYSDARFQLGTLNVVGRASKDGVTKRFHWMFDSPTRYERCEAVTTVEDGASTNFEITVHADHFFYDSLVAEDPQVVFQALADADADNDGEITQSELAAADIGAYDPGSAAEVENLWDWLNAQSRTLGHVNGEGHCDGD